MNAITRSMERIVWFFLLLLLSKVTARTDDNRSLYSSSACEISAEISCFILDGVNNMEDCSAMDSIMPNECKTVQVAFEFQYCNEMEENAINLSEDLTEVKLWNENKDDNLDKTAISPNTCRTFRRIAALDTCGRRKGFST